MQPFVQINTKNNFSLSKNGVNDVERQDNK